MRVCFHQAKQLNRSFADAHTPHPSATPPPSPQVGKAKRNLESFLFTYTFRVFRHTKAPTLRQVLFLFIVLVDFAVDDGAVGDANVVVVFLGGGGEFYVPHVEAAFSVFVDVDVGGIGFIDLGVF